MLIRLNYSYSYLSMSMGSRSSLNHSIRVPNVLFGHELLVKGEGVFLERLKNVLEFAVIEGYCRHLLFDVEFELEGCPHDVILEIVGLTHHPVGFFT